MSIVALICFCIAILLVASFFWRRSDIFSPGRLFALVWLVAIGFAELKLSGLQHRWSSESWLTLLLGVSGFLLGTLLVYIVNFNRSLRSLEEMRQTVRYEPFDSQRLFRYLLLGFGGYVLGYVVTYLIKGFIPIFSYKGALQRSEFQVFAFGLLLHSIVFIVFFSVLFHIVAPRKNSQKRIVKIIALLTIVTFVFLLQRYQLMMAAIMSFVLLYYLTNKIRFWNTSLFVALAGIFFYAVLSVRTGQVLQLYLASVSKMRLSPDLAFITEPYMYVVMNLENFARGVDRIDHHTYGFLTADFFLALTGLKHLLIKYFQIDMTPYVISGYNTFTSLWSYYRDFGLVGLFAAEFLLGAGISVLYYRMRNNPSIPLVCMYAVAVFVILLSFFMNVLSLLWFVFNLFVIGILLWLTSLRYRRSRERVRVQAT